jgi:hypothetical protein
MKVCTKCKVEKEFSEFSKDKTRKDNSQLNCKKCNEQYVINNKEKIIQYKLENKEHLKEYDRQYKIKNKENIKQYRLENKESRNKKEKERRHTDPLYKLSGNIRSLILISIKKQGYSKKSKTYEILGCSYEDFKIHLESQFTEGMTWDNQGLWHLDHIYPISRATDEQHVIKLNHYTNFQPLWAEDNNKKYNKI